MLVGQSDGTNGLLARAKQFRQELFGIGQILFDVAERIEKDSQTAIKQHIEDLRQHSIRAWIYIGRGIARQRDPDHGDVQKDAKKRSFPQQALNPPDRSFMAHGKLGPLDCLASTDLNEFSISLRTIGAVPERSMLSPGSAAKLYNDTLPVSQATMSL